MTGSDDANADLKAKMREALERKNESRHPSDAQGTSGSREKVHGSEIDHGAPQMHRRKTGGGGS